MCILKHSLTRTTLLSMGFRIALVIIVVTLISYRHVVSILESQTIDQLEKYVIERGQRESELFRLAEDNHAELKKELLWQLEKLSHQDPQAEFDRLFVRWPDGVIRNRAEHFDGTRQAGVYLDKNLTLNADIRRRILIFYDLVMKYGPAWHNRFQDTYITTPENVIVIYWPEFPNWAQEASADLYMPDEEYVWVADKQHNLSRTSVWTGLFYDQVSKLAMVSGETPVDITDQHIATIGHDIIINELLDRTLSSHLEGAYNLIFREDGRLITHPEHMTEIIEASGQFDIIQSKDQHLISIFQAVKNRQFDHVVIENTQNDEYLAITKIEGPDWYFVTVYPQSLLAKLAFKAASFILILGVISLFIEIIILFFVLRQQVAQPLDQFVKATNQIAADNLNIQLDTTRQDELGCLAHSFNAMVQEVYAREEGLKQVQASLQQANRLKDEFLANTSHELRTPLNGIIGIAESLLDGATGPLSPKTNTNLAMIISSGRRLANLVNDILDFSQLKHKNIDLQLKPVSMREVVEIIIMTSQSLKGEKNLQLINAIDPNLPPVLADENRVQQILYNLTGNAIKFTESGQITISATLDDSSPNQNHLIITVSDTGIGIATDKLELIFQAFEQAEGSTARNYGGTGLGLSITQQLVELHQGKIWVDSAEGVGSQFSFTLPISEEPAQNLLHQSTLLTRLSAATTPESSVSHSASQPSSTTPPPPGEFKILIVDDEPVNLQVLINHLSLHNYDIIQASSGPEALALLEDGLQPDLILLDVMMPKMTGYEVVRKIRETWEAHELPTLLLTAKNQISDLVAGLEAGANDYLTKPISKDELLARIKTHVNIKRLKEENLRMKAELEVARRLQQMLLPKDHELCQIDSLEIVGFMEPAEEVGGDYYDVLQHEGRVKIGIGDVTGHGLESGVLALMVQTTVRTLLDNDEIDPVKFLSALNRTIYDNVQRMNSDKSLTLVLLDYQENCLNITGQHEEIIVVRKGELQLIDTVELGFPIGLEPNIDHFVTTKHISLESGDVIVFYTDGITEAPNLEGEQYGLERLCEVVSLNWQKSAAEIRALVIEDVRRYMNQNKLVDDMTLLVLKQR